MAYKLYSSLPLGVERKNLAVINTEALAANYQALRRKAAGHGARAIAVVKADAYGHGIPICVPALLRAGCDFFAVASLAEAILVRKVAAESGFRADVLILGYTEPSAFPLLCQYHLIQTVFSEAYGKALADAAEASRQCVRVHFAADTGMHRVGFAAYDDSSIEASCRAIKQLSKRISFRVEGLYSHLACADSPSNECSADATKRQIERFDRLSEQLSAHKVRISMRHLSNSAGLFAYPEAACDAVRLGISLYGIAPVSADIELSPVMRLESRIVHLHTLAPGEALGYGGNFLADTPRLIATLPIGYADGFLRAFRGASVALYTRSGRCTVPVVGNVCMDQCMLDVTDTDAALGDRVVLFGDTPLDIFRLADRANTIPYEILTSVSARVDRV